MAYNVPNDYRMTDNEINNVVYLISKYLFNWGMRECDLQICIIMSDLGTNPRPSGPDAIDRLVNATSEYLWDHVAREPDEFPLETVVKEATGITEAFFNDVPASVRDTL